MTDTARFQVSGKQYEVSRSLLRMQPSSRLARMASDPLNSDPKTVIAVEYDGDRFQLVLDYLEDQGHVILPKEVTKAAFLEDLAVFGIENIGECFILPDCSSSFRLIAHIKQDIRAEMDSWNVQIAIIILAWTCSSMYLKCDKLEIIIHHEDMKSRSLQNDTLRCSLDTWAALLALLRFGGTQISCPARGKCNEYLGRVGLEIVSVATFEDECAMKVVMKLTDVESVSSTDNDGDGSDEPTEFLSTNELIEETM